MDGNFTIPTRIYLTTDQRKKLMNLVQQHKVDVHELLTELLVSFLDHLPAYEQPDNNPPESDHTKEIEIRKRRAEIHRLQVRATVHGDQVPAWLQRYITDLELELKKQEEQHP